MPGGRPSTYSPEIAAEVCRRIAEGELVSAITAETDMPSRSALWDWQQAHPEFADMYARARERAGDAHAERAVTEALAIADPQQQRLRFDALRWFAAKVAPKKYGEKTLHAGADGEGPVKTETKVTVEIVRPHDEGSGGV